MTEEKDIGSKRQIQAREAIKGLRQTIEASHAMVDHIAKEYIPDFHFLDYSVSTFWECENSPIGMCLFHINDRGEKTVCRYCRNPVERK